MFDPLLEQGLPTSIHYVAKAVSSHQIDHHYLFFFQGLSIASIQGSDKCTVLATDTSREKAQDVGEFMRLGGNRNVTMTSDQWEFRIMPSDIEDTSFINPRAHEYCSGGYRWTSMVQGMPGRPDNGGKI